MGNKDTGRGLLSILIRVLLIAGTVVLAMIIGTYLSDRARLVLGGAICVLGVIIALVMLVVLIRQADDGG
jgi:hypothetical protein